MSKKQGRTKNITINKKQLKKDLSINSKYFKWSLNCCDWEHEDWNKPKINVPFFVEHIISKLQNFETQTWQEIYNASGGKSEGNGNNNHYIIATKLPQKEKIYYIKKKYMSKFDEVFSLRLSGKERLIGFVDKVVFYIIWYDDNHNFFPCK